MPKIYEYLGIVMFFYSKEHDPIHIHARCGKFETKAEFVIKNGKIVATRFLAVGGYKPLTGKDLRNLETFLTTYSEKIVEKWIDFFVFGKDVTFERITKRI